MKPRTRTANTGGCHVEMPR